MLTHVNAETACEKEPQDRVTSQQERDRRLSSQTTGQMEETASGNITSAGTDLNPTLSNY